MERRLFSLIFVVLVLGLSASSFAVCFNITSRVSYEPDEEPNLKVTSPDTGVEVNWPVLGGVNGVPEKVTMFGEERKNLCPEAYSLPF